MSRNECRTDGGAPDSDGPTVLVVDNYDSFAYNLVQYVGEVIATDAYLPSVAGEVLVRRNDAVDIAGIRALDPDAIVVSPGPGTPEDAGVSMPIFAECSYPTLGVCLGHQALCAASGAPVGHAEAVVHGKPSTISHDGRGVFAGLDSPIAVGRYHSLAVDRSALPDCLTETAHTVRGVDEDRPDDGADDDVDGSTGDQSTDREPDEHRVVMAVRHDELPHVGVQFHPESILTEAGKQLVATFCDRALEGSL